jgi:hypothetical protein
MVSGGEITISDPLNEPFVYPAHVAGMTDVEFFTWATKFNQQQEREIIYSDQSKWLEGTATRVRGQSESRTAFNGRVYRAPATRRGDMTFETYPTRYLNPEYVPPTSLMIVNPFCPPTRE